MSVHGLPQKVHTDLGSENTEVWCFMASECVLVGSSVQNERIERLWCDVFSCVLSLFYETFKQLENDGCLDCLNEVDMFCLHYIFLPCINTVLKEFTEFWNNHSVSTEKNLTPNQLYVQGFLQQGTVPLTSPDALPHNTICFSKSNFSSKVYIFTL